MNQGEFTDIFCARPQNFAWFLGAGASRTAGLPTATDIIWDMKRRYYCREENQEISRQDIQNDAVKARIQSFMASRGFPPLGCHNEYSAYFEQIFGDDKERQRRYLAAILSENNIRLSVGNRVLGALMVSGLCRAVFTTNFDTVVEKAVAEVGNRSIAAYHLEGAGSAVGALNNEEFPLYCKLHGDFRHDSLKNLPADLAAQHASLSQCLINAANRFGFVIAGYSGRDNSIMELFRAALDTHNPFPHGFFWTGIKGAVIPRAVEDLLTSARKKGVNAQHVPIETFDALLLRLWRNIGNKSSQLDANVRKSRTTNVHIPLSAHGTGQPLLRLNALPIVSLPRQCQSLSFRTPKDWEDLRKAERESRHNLILAKSDLVWCWGSQRIVGQAFGDSLTRIDTVELPADLAAPDKRFLKGFVETALCAALARSKPVFSRTTPSGSFLIADPRPEARTLLAALATVVGGATSGIVHGLLTPVSAEHPIAEKVTWSEALKLSVDFKAGKAWLLLEPDIWIWPRHGREIAVEFLDKRRGDRFNSKHNALLEAWIGVILGGHDSVVTVRTFESGSEAENPAFAIAIGSAFSRRLA